MPRDRTSQAKGPISERAIIPTGVPRVLKELFPMNGDEKLPLQKARSQSLYAADLKALMETTQLGYESMQGAPDNRQTTHPAPCPSALPIDSCPKLGPHGISVCHELAYLYFSTFLKKCGKHCRPIGHLTKSSRWDLMQGQSVSMGRVHCGSRCWLGLAKLAELPSTLILNLFPSCSNAFSPLWSGTCRRSARHKSSSSPSPRGLPLPYCSGLHPIVTASRRPFWPPAHFFSYLQPLGFQYLPCSSTSRTWS